MLITSTVQSLANFWISAYSWHSSMLTLASFLFKKLEFENMLMSMLIKKPAFFTLAINELTKSYHIAKRICCMTNVPCDKTWISPPNARKHIPAPEVAYSLHADGSLA